jgi:hypothetical protein
LDRPGRSPLDLTPIAETLRWATAAVGGFADAGFALEGDRRRDLSVLGMVRISIGAQLLWEGQVEDTVLRLSDTGFTTEVSCYGLRRRLEQTSVKRIWVKRDMSWTSILQGFPAFLLPGASINPQNQATSGGAGASGIGQYDVSDLTKFGLRFEFASGASLANNQGIGMELILPGVTLTALLFTYAGSGNEANSIIKGLVGASAGGASWASTDYNANGNYTLSLPASCDRVRVCQYWNHVLFTTTSIIDTDFYNLRFLGATTTEDGGGPGLYGGTILRDLISLVPELSVGVIDDGSDFLIDQMDRAVRDTALSVFEETSGYYPQREWGVWEDGRTDWTTRNLDEPQWLLTVQDLAALELTSSIDSLVKTVYLSYVEVPTFTSKEATAVSVDQRNPYVKSGKTKDAVVSVPFVMTSATSQQLATVLARLQGGYIPASGTVTVAPTTRLSDAVGTRKPACMIRAGENIVISDLPKTAPLDQGRDGETLFHVATCETSFEENKVTLTVESLDRRSDVLLARLAAATRSVGG